MKLTTVVVSAIMALGVAAVPFAEAVNDVDVDVEARDFSGESLNEFDARSPEEEEFETRDEEDDLVARGDYNNCGYGAYEKGGKCYCHDHKLVYNEHKKKCEKPFSCKGKYVKIEDDGYGNKKCKCEREGQYYDSWKGCVCKKHFEYSEKFKKCIPDCPHGEEYDGHECKKPFSCKGKNVEIVDDYGVKSCKCKLSGQTYDEHKGCVCPKREYFSSHWKKCVPKCEHGYEYDGHECKKPFSCKGKNVEIVDNYGVKSCKCKLEHQSYDEHKGCQCDHGYSFSWKEKKCIKDCPHGEVYSWEHKKCYKPCVGKNVREVWEYDNLTCKCDKRGQEYDEHKGCYYKCPEGSKYNEHKRECVCTNWQEELKHGKCVDRCPKDHSSWNGHKCVCDKGYESRWGKCVKPPTCPYGSYLKDWNCVCKDKAKKFEHGRCVERCPNDHDHYNSWSKKCECDKGYESKWGKCVKKPECKGYGAYFDEHKWQCKCKNKDYEYTKDGCKKKDSYGHY